MKAPKQQLAVISPQATVEAAVVPKPTRRELIEALAQTQHKKAIAEWREATDKRRTIEDELNAWTLQQVKNRILDLVSESQCAPSVCSYEENVYRPGEVRFEITEFPAAIIKKMNAMDAIKVNRWQPTLDEARKLVRAKMSGLTVPLEFS